MEKTPAKRQPQVLPMIFAGASNRDLVKQFVKLTPEKVLGGNYPSMAKIKKQEGEKKLSEALAIIIIETSVAFGEAMNQHIALDLAIEILTDYYYLTLEDCFLVLNRLKRTKVFKLTINVVLTAFENYDNERLKIIDDNNYSQHLSIKEERGKPTTVDALLREIKMDNRNRKNK